MKSIILPFILILSLSSYLPAQPEFDNYFHLEKVLILEIPDSIIPMSDIKDIAVTEDGFMYSIEFTGGRVFKFSPSGEFITCFGGKQGFSKSNLETPEAIRIDRDKNELIVTDWLNS